MRTEVDHSRLKYQNFQEDSIWVDGHLFLPWFLEHWDRYPRDQESLPAAWAMAWTHGSQNRGFNPGMEEAMMELLEGMELDEMPMQELMSEAEQQRLHSLQYPVQVFRGVNLKQREDLDLSWPGCCWTLSQERAEWFARRPGNAAAVLKLQLNHPWEIKACFLERNEEEIVVDCRNLDPPAVSWI